MSAGASTVGTSTAGEMARTLPQCLSPVPQPGNQWPLPLTRPDQRSTGGWPPVRPGARQAGHEELARQAVGGKRSWWWQPANGRGPDGGGAPAAENPDDAAVAGSNGAGEPCICHAQGRNDAWGPGPGPGSGRFSVAGGASLRFTKKPGEGDAYRCGCWGGTNVLWGCASH